MEFFRIFRKTLPFFLIIWITGCGSAPRYTVSLFPEEEYVPAEKIAQYLWNGVKDWQGVPYKWGGENTSGVDCSGFTKTVYRELFDIRLPRTAQEQATIGSPVRTRQLRPGDLVFFQDGSKVSHVGIYLGKRKFIHASQKKGVTVSRLDAPYWQKIYHISRRVL